MLLKKKRCLIMLLTTYKFFLILIEKIHFLTNKILMEKINYRKWHKKILYNTKIATESLKKIHKMIIFWSWSLWKYNNILNLMKKQKDLKTKAERTSRKILKNIKMSLNKKMIKGKKGSRKTSKSYWSRKRK